jgi:hypothetical protein
MCSDTRESLDLLLSKLKKHSFFGSTIGLWDDKEKRSDVNSEVDVLR